MKEPRKNFILKTIVLALLSLQPLCSWGFSVEFSGVSKKVIEVAGDKNTGLEKIYVVFNASEVTKIEISGIVGTPFEVSRYSNLGGGYAENVPFSMETGSVIINSPVGNTGYIVSCLDKTYCFWIVDYSSYPFHPTGIEMAEEQDCDNTKLIVSGVGSDIHYYTIDGRQRILSREIDLSYHTLQWDKEEKQFLQILESKSLASISGNIIITPPIYCSTIFSLTGDRFLKEWGLEVSLESSSFSPTGIAVESEAIETNISYEDASNVIKTEVDGLGGSAPCDIDFIGYLTDGVLHTEWQIASDPDFEYVTSRFNQQDLSYSFTEEGRYYVRFIGSNADGSCEQIGETYNVMVGASDLRIPNAFSPNNDGINDVWKVGYRSLLEFKCWIFDSKGNKLYEFSDPSGGWDGKYRGKIVKPGVYFYVIQAKGADGKNYKKSGDINILNYKKYGDSTVGGTEE